MQKWQYFVSCILVVAYLLPHVLGTRFSKKSQQPTGQMEFCVSGSEISIDGNIDLAKKPSVSYALCLVTTNEKYIADHSSSMIRKKGICTIFRFIIITSFFVRFLYKILHYSRLVISQRICKFLLPHFSNRIL